MTVEFLAYKSAQVDRLDYDVEDTTGQCPLRLINFGSFPSSSWCFMSSGHLDIGEPTVSLAASSQRMRLLPEREILLFVRLRSPILERRWLPGTRQVATGGRPVVP